MTDDQADRLIAAVDRLTDAIERIEKHLSTPSPAWRRLLDELKATIARMPTSVRMRF